MSMDGEDVMQQVTWDCCGIGAHSTALYNAMSTHDAIAI